MAWAVNASGTLAATASGTEDTLKDETSPAGKTFVLYVDMNALANDDVVELRAYAKVLTGGTLRVAWTQTYAHAQGTDNAVAFSVPIIGFWNVKFTLTVTTATSRSFPWELYEQ
jgi:hypothetical protein